MFSTKKIENKLDEVRAAITELRDVLDKDKGLLEILTDIRDHLEALKDEFAGKNKK